MEDRAGRIGGTAPALGRPDLRPIGAVLRQGYCEGHADHEADAIYPITYPRASAAGKGAKRRPPPNFKIQQGYRGATESGRPDSNRRRPAWEAGILPLNYARDVALQ